MVRLSTSVAVLASIAALAVPAMAQPDLATAQPEPAAQGQWGVPPEVNAPWNPDVPDSVRKRANRLFAKGNQLADENFLISAIERYKLAIDLWAHPVYFFNLAMVEIRASLPVAAYWHLRRALQYGAAVLSEDQEKAKVRFDEGSKRVQMLEDQLTHVDIVCNEPGAQVFFREDLLFTGPGRRTGLTTVGLFSLIAIKDGYENHIDQGVLSPGQPKRFDLILSSRHRERRFSQAWPVVTGSLGLAISLAGLAFHRQSSNAFREYDEQATEHCGDGGCDSQHPQRDGIDAIGKRARIYRNLGTAAYAVGAAALVTATAMFLFNREREVLRRSVHGRGAFTIAPAVSPESASIQARVSF